MHQSLYAIDYFFLCGIASSFGADLDKIGRFFKGCSTFGIPTWIHVSKRSKMDTLLFHIKPYILHRCVDYSQWSKSRSCMHKYRFSKKSFEFCLFLLNYFVCKSLEWLVIRLTSYYLYLCNMYHSLSKPPHCLLFYWTWVRKYLYES